MRIFPHVRFGAVAILLLAAPPMLFPLMQESGDVRLRTETRVVEVDVSVRDAQGKPVEDLRKEDFTILDNGQPRAFTIFNSTHATPLPAPAGSGQPSPSPAGAATPPSALPPNVFTNLGAPQPAEGHSTVILLDGLNGWFDNFALSRQGVIGMLNKVPADEKIALYVISKNQGLVILQDYTLDRARLLDAMSKYTPHAMCPAPVGFDMGEGLLEPMVTRAPPKPPAGDSAAASLAEIEAKLNAVTKVSACQGVGQVLTDAEQVRLSLKSLAQRLGSQPGRKSVFWITQGFPPWLLRGEYDGPWSSTISALNDANVAVNTVDSNGLGGPPRMWGRGGTLSMIQLADRTGGHAYYNRNDLDAAIAQGVVDSRSGYMLGFYLTDLDDKFHELKVRVNRPGLTLNYRRGYYAQDQAKTDASQRKSELAAALLNPADSSAVGITASLDATPGNPQGTLNVRLKLSPNSISLKPNGAAWAGKVEELLVELNADGREVGRISSTTPFAVTSEQRAVFDNQGVTTVQTFLLRPEAVKLSIVVRDTESGRTGSLTVPLDKVIQAPPK